MHMPPELVAITKSKQLVKRVKRAVMAKVHGSFSLKDKRKQEVIKKNNNS